MNKKSGDPDSRAGARSLKRPYFLSAKCAYPIKRGTLSPEGFCFIGRIFYETRKSPASRTLAPERGRFSGHTSLARSAHPPGGFLFHRTNFPVK